MLAKFSTEFKGLPHKVSCRYFGLLIILQIERGWRKEGLVPEIVRS